jgi:high frequency lysogenization protein
MSERADRQQALALAAVFQAASLADELACHGRFSNQRAAPLLDAVLNLDPESTEAVYPDPGSLDAGLVLLENAFSGGQQREQLRVTGYALALMQLAARLRRNNDLIDILRNRLEALAAQRSHFNDIADVECCHRMAGIYLDTLGTFRFRIRVQGEPAHLQNDDNAARIRALFLAGVRAAFLWHQAGGRRWHLLTRRKRLLEAVRSLRGPG